jgi:3-methyladenine DNA glycosylase AlkC
MKKLKDIFSKQALVKTATAVAKHHPAFAQNSFVDSTWKKISVLELKDRVKEISRSLKEHLPLNYPDAVAILLSAAQNEKNSDGLSGFLAWPIAQFIEDYGIDHFDCSVDALKRITPAMSAEFAIRPFLKQYPDRMLPILLAWTKDPNVHVRRLVSEGTRPLLPWGQQLPEFRISPSLTLPLLRALAHSEELYVRKSIANHFNDIAKDHPKLLLNELREWRKKHPGNENLEWVYRHGLRTLLKKGNQDALKFLGFGGEQIQVHSFAISPRRLKIESNLLISLKFKAKQSAALMIDYAVHHRKANGQLVAKVFKWKKLQVRKGELVVVQKKHPIRKISTRKYYPGTHKIEIMINGRSHAMADFQLLLR